MQAALRRGKLFVYRCKFVVGADHSLTLGFSFRDVITATWNRKLCKDLTSWKSEKNLRFRTAESCLFCCWKNPWKASDATVSKSTSPALCAHFFIYLSLQDSVSKQLENHQNRIDDIFIANALLMVKAVSAMRGVSSSNASRGRISGTQTCKHTKIFSPCWHRKWDSTGKPQDNRSY